jgi:hypothetical protein
MLLALRKQEIVRSRIGTLRADILPNVVNEQMMRIVVRYGEKHPDQTHRYLWLLALDALTNS